MKILEATDLGQMETYDLVVDDDYHSFVHETGVVVHNSGWLVTNRPVHELVPLTTVGGVKVTQFAAPACEAMGFIKMDFLVVNSLVDISEAIKLIQRRSGIEIPADGKVLPMRGKVPAHQLIPHKGEFYDVWALPDDVDVAKDIVHGRSETVFQFNTPSATGWLAKFRGNKPDGTPAIAGLYDLAVFTALDRPGPLEAYVDDPEAPGQKRNMLEEYAARVQGRAKSSGVLPAMEKLFPETHAIMVFQEQLQYMYQKLSGRSGAEAEQFRRDVAKKKAPKVQAAFDIFFPGAAQLLGEEMARKAWDQALSWSAYGFNKSHAVCYALIGYVTAWLKHHYPLEWWCAVLRNASKKEITEKFWAYIGHKIDLPDLSRVAETFEIDGDRIVAPVSLLHGVGEKAHKQLVEGGPYTDLYALVRGVEAYKDRTATKVMKKTKNKKTGEEEVKEHLKRGTSAVNGRIVRTLMIVGALDKLLPEDIRNATILEKLAYYEKVAHEVRKTKRPAPVPAWYGKVGVMALYVLRKKYLPAFAADLRPIVAELGRPDIEQGVHGLTWNGRRLMSASMARQLQVMSPLPPEGIKGAAVAYVVSTRPFIYQVNKQAVEVVLDIQGETFKMVSWPGKKPFPTDVDGCLVLVMLERWNDARKEFSIRDIEILQRPVKEEDEDGEEQGSPGDQAGGNPDQQPGASAGSPGSEPAAAA